MNVPPKARKFDAWINLQPTGSPKIIVVGEVETRSSADQPRLTENEDPRPPNTTFELDLTIRNTGGIGTQAFQFRKVRFEAPAVQGQFDKVLILWQGKVCSEFDVGEAH